MPTIILKNYLVVLIFFLTSIQLIAQKGIVSGVLNDDTGPLPAVNVTIKGSEIGTETDFDGKYSIECSVGDTLVFSFVGMETKEVIVTRALFDSSTLSYTMHEKAVKKIISTDYFDALKKVVDSINLLPEISEQGLKYNQSKGYFNIHRIRNIKETNKKIKVTYFRPDILYQVNFNSDFSLRFVDKSKLPKTQNTFAQGRPFNNTNEWFGAETGEIFSFGPNVNTITFDGANYPYDTNGRLINGTGQRRTLPYNNSIFETNSTLSNNLNLKVSNTIHSADINLRRKTQKDIFNTERNRLHQLDFNYDFRNKISAFLKLNDEINNQPNTNGFLNNVILNSFATPNSFQNTQGYIFSNNEQRSFSPSSFNNPYWLLNLNQNSNKNNSLVFGVKTDINIKDNLKLNAIISYNNEKSILNFGLPINTFGFEQGYKSKKSIIENALNTYIDLDYNFNVNDFSEITINSSVKYKNNNLNYQLTESQNFTNFSFNNPSIERNNVVNLNNNTLRLNNKVKFDFFTNSDLELTLANNSVFNTFQGNKPFLPSARLYIELYDLLGYPDWMNSFSITTAFSKEAKETPLFYSNLSHNSLTISPQESQSLLANNDLFNSKELMFETGTNFDIETSLRLFRNKVTLGVNYYYSKTKDGVFPVLNNNSFQLENLATVKNQGLEASLELNIGRDWNDFFYTPTFIFSKNRGKVLHLNGNRNSLPIAGFSNVSNNLIVGEQTGTIVGSAYLRNDNGEIIIDTDGYPMISADKQIIGNTTPNFNLSMHNSFKIGKLNINFLIDYQNGGDVWNGTKNVLNYLGRSQESENLRGTTNFIFDGVNQSGTTNTTLVDFANPTQDISQNRWVRYGFDGVDEAAIADGSFINLKSIGVSYNFADNNRREFFRKLQVSLYANNLISFTKEKGISPYSSLFDYSLGKGLDYFNIPIIKEVGFKINIQI